MELTNSNDLAKLINENSVLIIEFYSTWCPPCKMVRPLVAEYILEHEDDLIVSVNTDVFNDLAKKYHISTVPTFFCYKDGELVDSFEGHIEYEDLEEEFNRLKTR